MNNPQLSVVMCAYNEELFIAQAIDSILSQTYPDFELIIVDDASTDHTSEIIKNYADDRVFYIKNDTNLGPYRSANKGIASARGNLIARHDADDVSIADRFMLQTKAFEKNPQIGLVSTDFEYIDASGKKIETVNLPQQHDVLFERLTKGNIFSQGALMFRKSCFEQLDGYREEFPVSQDYDMWLRLSEITQLENIPQVLYRMRFHLSSISRNKRELQLSCKDFAWAQAQRRRSGLAELPIPGDILSAYPPDPRKLFLDARGSSYLYFASGDLELAADTLKRAFDLESDGRVNVQAWLDWAMSRAILLANICDDPGEGAAFLTWFEVNSATELDRKIVHKEIGRFYAQQAFNAYQQGNRDRAFRNGLLAIKNDVGWIKNRGLLAITVKSAF